MHKAIKIALWTLGTLLLLVAGLYAYLRNADLSVYEDQIEGALSNAIGHKIDVDGLFELNFANLTILTAEDVVITNSRWTEDPELLRIGHLSVTVDIWSLLSSPIVVDYLVVRDASITIQENEQGAANWDTGREKVAAAEPTRFDPNLVAFRGVRLDNIRFVIDQPQREHPLDLNLEHLTVTPDAADVLDLDLRGTVNEYSLSADGRLGPWQNLVDGRDLQADLDLAVGEVRLGIDGTVDHLATLEGLDLSMSLDGPAIERVARVLGLPAFASGEFQLEGEIHRVDDHNQFQLVGNIGDISINNNGHVDYLLNPRRADLEFRLTGPDAENVAAVFGFHGAPQAPFNLSGELSYDNRRVEFEHTRAELGDNSIDIEGWLDLNKKIPDGDITIRAAGPNIAVVDPFVGIDGIPAWDFNVSGRAQKSGRRVHFDNVVAMFGQNRIEANGTVDPDGGVDSEVFLSITGPDISFIQGMANLPDVPAKPFSASAYLRPDPIGINIDDAKLKVGDNQAEIDGVIGTIDGASGTDISIRAFGPELHNVSLLTGIPYLPYGEYEYRLDFDIEDETLTVRNFGLAVVGAEMAVNGSLNIGASAGDFDLGISISSGDVSQLELFQSLKELDGEALQLNGDVRNRGGVLDLREVTVDIGNVEAAVSGEFDSRDLSASLSVDANAPDSELLDRFLLDREIPAGALQLNGQIERNAGNIEFTDTSFRIGEFFFAVDGTLSNSPRSNSSDLDVSVAGPSLHEFGEMLGIGTFPPKTYRLSAEVNGTPTGFAIENIDAAVGENKIDARFTADLEGKPRVTGELQATYVDLASQLANAASEPGPPSDSPYVVPDDPLPLEWLQSLDADIDVKAERLLLTNLDVHDFHIDLQVEDGTLRIDPISLGELNGMVSGYFHVTPLDDTYALDASVQIENIHFGFVDPAGGTVRSAMPALNGNINLTGTGNTVHEIMSNANGRIFLSQSSGRTSKTFMSQWFGDVFTEIINTINPLRTQNEYTTLDCAFYIVKIDDGLATIEEIVMQTEAITLAATGSVNFPDEILKISVNTKSRKGFGVSVGGIANNFFNIRGTMKDPKLQLDVAGSAVTGGAAVATGGLSLVAKGLWDRMSSEKSICDQPRE